MNSKQEELIHLLESQVMDLTLMSKIELDDDVIQKIIELKEEIANEKNSNPQPISVYDFLGEEKPWQPNESPTTLTHLYNGGINPNNKEVDVMGGEMEINDNNK